MRIAAKTTSPKYPLNLSDLQDTADRIRVAYKSYLDIETPEDRAERHKRVAQRNGMVTLTIHYLNAAGEQISFNTDPMEPSTAMDRVMRFVQTGVDVINHFDTGTMEVLLMHRVTGITITPVG